MSRPSRDIAKTISNQKGNSDPNKKTAKFDFDEYKHSSTKISNIVTTLAPIVKIKAGYAPKIGLSKPAPSQIPSHLSSSSKTSTIIPTKYPSLKQPNTYISAASISANTNIQRSPSASKMDRAERPPSSSSKQYPITTSTNRDHIKKQTEETSPMNDFQSRPPSTSNEDYAERLPSGSSKQYSVTTPTNLSAYDSASSRKKLYEEVYPFDNFQFRPRSASKCEYVERPSNSSKQNPVTMSDNSKPYMPSCYIKDDLVKCSFRKQNKPSDIIVNPELAQEIPDSYSDIQSTESSVKSSDIEKLILQMAEQQKIMENLAKNLSPTPNNIPQYGKSVEAHVEVNDLKFVKVQLYNHENTMEMRVNKSWTGAEFLSQVTKQFKIRGSIGLVFAGRTIKNEDIIGNLKIRNNGIEDGTRILITAEVSGGIC